MKKFRIFFAFAAIAATAVSCSMGTIKPNYTSTNTNLLRIGGDKPTNPEPVVTNMGSYCLQITNDWKADGKTPDGQTIWTLDSLRKVVPCK